MSGYLNKTEAAAVNAGEVRGMFDDPPLIGTFDDGPVIELTQEFNKARMARGIPKAYWNGEWWVVNESELEPRIAVIILKLFPQLGIKYPQLFELQSTLMAEVRPFDNATPFNTRVDAPGVEKALAKDGHTMYDFQAIDLGYLQAVMEKHGGAYMGWERGLGKTMGSCSLIESTGSKQVLVIAPNTAKGPVWAPELKRFLPDAEVIVLPNAKAQRERCLESVEKMAKAGTPFIFVIHYEAIKIIGDGPKGKSKGKAWQKFGTWDMVIADEVHRIKNPKSLMAKSIKKIPSKYRLALSGSIIENHAEELYSPLQWLFPDRYSSKWRDWNDRFLDFNEGGYGKVFVGIKPDQLGNMQQELGVFMTYRRKQDELDLPKRTDQQLYVELTAGQRKVYGEMASSYLSDMPDGTRIKAIDGLSMLTKLRQIATGLDLLGEVSDSSKLDLAMDMIKDAEDEAFVVFCWYKATGYALQERLAGQGIESYVVTGDVKQQDRTEMIAEFQRGEADKPRVFIGTLSTLGESVNLQRANQAILLDRSWNPATNTQAEDRIYRMGQDKPVTITHILAKDTVDEHRVLPTITNKEALRGMVLGGK